MTSVKAKAESLTKQNLVVQFVRDLRKINIDERRDKMSYTKKELLWLICFYKAMLLIDNVFNEFVNLLITTMQFRRLRRQLIWGLASFFCRLKRFLKHIGKDAR